MAVDRNIIEKSGAWFSYEGARLGRGAKTPPVPRDHPQVFDEIMAKVKTSADAAPALWPLAAHRTPRANRRGVLISRAGCLKPAISR